MKLDRIKKIVADREIQYVDLKFCDLNGQWHHITIPASSLNEELFVTGVGMDGSSLPGWAAIERGDMILLPDPDTVFVDPFFERPTHCATDCTPSMEPMARDTRLPSRSDSASEVPGTAVM